MNWMGCGWEQLWLNWDTIMVSPWRDRKTTRNLSHYSHYATQDSNQTPPELKLEGVLLEATWLVRSKNINYKA